MDAHETILAIHDVIQGPHDLIAEDVERLVLDYLRTRG